jgi:hypothetical protein
MPKGCAEAGGSAEDAEGEHAQMLHRRKRRCNTVETDVRLIKP